MAASAERMCVYMVLTKGYETLSSQPIAVDSDVDFICFTDDHTLVSNTWDIRSLDLILPSDPTRSMKFPKLCPHRYLDDYDISLYIDNNTQLRQTPEEIVRQLLPPDTGFAAMFHEIRSRARQEFETVAQLPHLEMPWVVAEQLAHYQADRPDVLDSRPINGSFMLRRHNRKDVERAMERWLIHVLRYSRRDQLSARMAFAETDFEPLGLEFDPRDNPFAYKAPRRNFDRKIGGKLPTIAELDHATDELASTNIEVERLTTENRRLQQATLDTNERIEELETSTSWHITAPLRVIARRLRKLRQH
ncbi:MAG: DUF616 domain-containing protein [Acidimicrobiaceae bacterium]|jgi:hypothetical protein|nr:DUF616 domain-containing protein [Acidimicrobiaceae bacterium]MBT5580533.1 DUF616 domain-containing protein [Acidimicrobiaceae bacterium]MBT5849956.1 DUF616 domain-containing protein [Acidimicrobiaceae bacterium]